MITYVTSASAKSALAIAFVLAAKE